MKIFTIPIVLLILIYLENIRTCINYKNKLYGLVDTWIKIKQTTKRGFSCTMNSQNCLTSLAIWKMKVKTAKKYYFEQNKSSNKIEMIIGKINMWGKNRTLHVPLFEKSLGFFRPSSDLNHLNCKNKKHVHSFLF